MTNMFKAEIIISVQQVCDQIITAMEGGSGYWCDSFHLSSSEHKPVGRPWYADPKLYEGAFVIDVTTNEPSMPATYKLTPEAVQKGLNLLAKDYLTRIDEIVSGDGDAETADVFLQACLFGEIVFG